MKASKLEAKVRENISIAAGYLPALYQLTGKKNVLASLKAAPADCRILQTLTIEQMLMLFERKVIDLELAQLNVNLAIKYNKFEGIEAK